MIKRGKKRALGLDEPLRHQNHRKPVTRRDFLAQGFLTGSATVMAPSILGLLLNPRMAHALSQDIIDLKALCNITAGAGKIPFICFDLAGGANIAGSNVLVGQQGGQLDLLSTAGYSKLGLPGNMTPASSTTNFVNTQFGLAFHSDSAFLRGMLTRASATTMARVNGAVIPARSENDTGNNPHNPMYGIAKAGAKGELLTLIGSQSSDSGGNSMAPAMMIDPTVRPTKIDRTTDAKGLVDTGELATLLPQADTVSVMESIERISKMKLDKVSTKLDAPALTGPNDDAAKQLAQCGYVKTAYLAESFGSPTAVDPSADVDIKGGAGIFTDAEYTGEREFEKTASVMKLVVEGRAGAGTISMGGFDYHTGDRSTGEARDFRAGVCMGACLEFAARRGVPLMIYVFSDGSLSSNGMIDSSTGGRGKGVWTGDNQSTAASFFMVFDPKGRPTATRQQIGYYRASGDVETASHPGANAVNLLVETVILNYMALHGEQGNFANVFPNHGLGSPALRDSLTAFGAIVNGKIGA
ncbi:MAG TPA: hypothetical protein VEZ88_03335 [Steroidobacteraceae bacterium]|nr:hypothetical protein [Steroidobacteraceae bacterium]